MPQQEFTVKSRMEWLSSELASLYGRPKHHAKDYAEESMMFEVCRRAAVKTEFEEIKRFHDRLPAREKRYFPQSLTRLLSMWQEVLDRARTYNPNPQDRSIVERDAEKLCREINNDYPDPQ